eukprot:SAG31_NODE_770_length_12217_cov_2.855174_10_plen_173_part_00
MAAAIDSLDIQASTRVPPQADWMSAIGRSDVCMRAMSRTVRKQTALKFAKKVFGKDDFGSLPGCTAVACSAVSQVLHGSASHCPAFGSARSQSGSLEESRAVAKKRKSVYRASVAISSAGLYANLVGKTMFCDGVQGNASHACVEVYPHRAWLRIPIDQSKRTHPPPSRSSR